MLETSVSPASPPAGAAAAEGPLRPFLLVPDRTESADAWTPVARQLHAAGHAVLAVDAGQRHPDRRADDLADLLGGIGWTGGRAPVAVGRSWGGSVVVSLAARRALVAAVGCLGTGWSDAGEGFHPRGLLPHVDVPVLVADGSDERPGRLVDSLLALADDAEPNVLVSPLRATASA